MALVPGLVLAVALAGGCAGPGSVASSETPDGAEPGLLRLGADEYEAVFEATQEVLTRRGYRLARVDAPLGVIEAEPKPTPGFLYPLDGDQSSLGEVWADTFNAQRRRVRVTFAPAGESPAARIGAPGAPVQMPRDLTRLEDRRLEARVEVVVERRNVPGRRIETESMRRSGRWGNPAHGPRSMSPQYHVPLRRDAGEAARLAARISDLAGQRGASDAGGE